MSQELSVGEDIKQLISDIITRNELDSVSKVEYKPGSEVGDGYTSQIVAVNIQDKDKSLHLFLKCSLDVIALENFKMLFPIETFFYDVLHPAYIDFQKKHNVKHLFQNVPKLHGVVSDGPREIIALENLKPKGYELFNRFEMYNDAHLTAILKTFARFHAISYAFKDQERETYEKWRENLFDYNTVMKIGKYEQMSILVIKEFFSKLDQIEDKDIILAFGDLLEVINASFKTLEMDYATITKGNCWNNNMLFSYEDGNKQRPSDVMLIDWQLMKEASPLHDLLIFMHPMATQEMLDNMDHYMKIYHDELSLRISELGSDPEKLYPYSAFLKERDDMAPLALYNSLLVVKVILTEIVKQRILKQ